MRAARARWRLAAEQRHAAKREDPTLAALEMALRREPEKRTEEDLSLLAAWLAGVDLSPAVRRTMDVDAMCRTMRCLTPASEAEEIVVTQGDAATALFIPVSYTHLTLPTTPYV